MLGDYEEVEEHAVQARFTPHGKLYTYSCPGAQVGDFITGPNCTGSAEVIYLGRHPDWNRGLTRATIIKKYYQENTMNHHQINQMNLTAEEQIEAHKNAIKELKEGIKRRKVAEAKAEAKHALHLTAMKHLTAQSESGNTQATIELLRLTGG